LLLLHELHPDSSGAAEAEEERRGTDERADTEDDYADREQRWSSRCDVWCWR
jgi:hypothetical protein